MHVVATAGHVDHGKSTLVRALTGTDPDRLAEEQQRGLTIDLGFAFCTLPSGRGVSFVDVPGHIRFVKNMLAGVGAVDACMFVVAATEGWKPQSEEHLRILELLGIAHGVVALTQTGLVDAELAELAELDVSEHVEGSFLERAAIVPTDAVSGIGLDRLAAALDDLCAVTPTAADRDRPRLWIDRSWAAVGAGRVVTGTLAGGSLHIGETLAPTPGRGRVRIRAIQSQGRARDRIGPGHRVALNLVGADGPLLRRGVALVRPGQWHIAPVIDAQLTVLAHLSHEVTRRGAFALYLGSGEWPVRLRVLGPEAIGPGESGCVRMHLPEGLALLPGDRFVLRDFGRGETVGGGEVLDVDPQLRASRAAPDRSVARVVAERGWVEVEELERLTGERVAPVLGRWTAPPELARELRERLRDLIADAGPLGLDTAQFGEIERLALAEMPDVTITEGRARQAGAADTLDGHPVVAELESGGFAPSPPTLATQAELHALAQRGEIVRADGVWFARSVVERAAQLVADLLAAQPAGITVAEVREAMGTTRKFALPLMGHLDRSGVTRRRGDARIGGPRLPPASPPTRPQRDQP